MINLAQTGEFAPLSDFEAENLPRFVVITGLNGSGKTKILDGIKQGVIKVFQEGPLPIGGVSFFEPIEFPNAFDVSNYSYYNQYSFMHGWSMLLKELDDLRQLFHNNHAKLNETFDDFIVRISEEEAGFDEYDWDERVLIRPQLNKRAQEIIQNTQNNNLMPGGNLLGLVNPKKLMFVNFSDFGFLAPSALHTARITYLYLDFLFYRLARRYVVMNNAVSDHVIDKDDLLLRFDRVSGKDPMEIFNRLLDDIGLPYEIRESAENNSYSFSIHHKNDGIPVEPKQLSGGEQVLFNLASAMYRASGDRGYQSQPSIILMDEVDAKLHPANTARFMDAIQRIIERDSNIAVLSVTHSATSVAQAPEESLFIKRRGENCLEKITRSQAIESLTVGVPTLSVDFSNRVFVLCEAEIDAKIYDRLFQIARTVRSYSITPVFIPSGRKHEAGSSRVVDVVPKFEGTNRVIGVVDYDDGSSGSVKNNRSQRIKVLGYGVRYAIENVIIDPYLLVLLCSRRRKEWMVRQGLYIPMTSISSPDASEVQSIISNLSRTVFGKPIEMEEHTYGNEMVIQYDSRWSKTQGHRLVEILYENLEFLGSVESDQNNDRGNKLMLSIITDVIDDAKFLIPPEMLELFKDIESSVVPVAEPE